MMSSYCPLLPRGHPHLSPSASEGSHVTWPKAGTPSAPGPPGACPSHPAVLRVPREHGGNAAVPQGPGQLLGQTGILVVRSRVGVGAVGRPKDRAPWTLLLWVSDWVAWKTAQLDQGVQPQSLNSYKLLLCKVAQVTP